MMRTSKLARRLGFKTARQKGFWKGLNYLHREGIIEIIQGGYHGDNLHHPRLVKIINAKLLLVYFKVVSPQPPDLYLQTLTV